MGTVFSKLHLNLLEEFGLDQLDVSKIQLVTFKKGDLLCEQGGEIHEILIVVSGRVKVYTMTPEGKILLQCYNGKGTMVGEVELMNGGVATSTLCAVKEVECIKLPFDLFEDELRRNTRFLYKASCAMAEIIARSTTNDSLNILYPVEERMKSYILTHHVQGIFDENLMETAQFLGVSYRHLLRIINKFCEGGYLKKEGKGYHIMDFQFFEIQKEQHYLKQW